MTICDTFVLSKGDFHDVLDDFPEMRATMETVAEERLKEIKATRTLKKTRLLHDRNLLTSADGSLV